MRSGLIATVIGVCIALAPISAQAATTYTEHTTEPAAAAQLDRGVGHAADEPDGGETAAVPSGIDGQDLIGIWLSAGVLMFAGGAVTLVTSIRRTRKQQVAARVRD